MLEDIRDYANQNSNLITFPVEAGDHYLKLRTIADNAASSSREFKLHISQDKSELPKLEALQ